MGAIEVLFQTRLNGFQHDRQQPIQHGCGDEHFQVTELGASRVRARNISSQTPITDTSELSLSIEMNWLPVGGMIRRMDCGRMTRVIV